MRLSARPLSDVTGVNGFVPATEVHASAGDPLTLYVQFVDLDKLPSRLGFNPPGLRYVPAPGATLLATVLNLLPANQFDRVSTQPFAGDPSIWAITIFSTDPLDNTVNVRLRLTEGAVTRTVTLPAVLLLGASQETC